MKKTVLTDDQILELAQDLYSDLKPWEKGEETTVEKIADGIKNDPYAVIDYLITRFCE